MASGGAACEDPDADSKAESAPCPAQEEVQATPLPRRAREGGHVLRSLLSMAPRAELRARGLVMNLGHRDQNKYTRGGWRSGWDEDHTRGKAHLDAQGNAKLFFYDERRGASAVRLRARSLKEKQKLTLYLDREAVSTQELPLDWQVLTFPLSSPVEPGRHTLTLAFSRQGNARSPTAQVDWVWLATAPATDRPIPVLTRTATRDHGRPISSLVADPPRRLSFYLVVPREASLIFDYGASQAADFEVRLLADGAQEALLFQAHVRGGEGWQEGAVDLTTHGGEVVRLDLLCSGAGGEAAWGDPVLMRRGEAPRVPAVTREDRARNLIYVLIDTARQDAFKPFNPLSRVLAPALEALAEESVIFRNAYTSGNWTKPSVATALSGLYPSSHGAVDQDSVLPRSVPLLSRHLQQAGFRTAAFVANGYVSRKFGFKRGWDTWRNYIREDRPTEAAHVYTDALQWLQQPQQRQGRFFLYIHTIDPHVPYHVPGRYSEPYFGEKYDGPLGERIIGEETQAYLEGKLKLSARDRRWIRAVYDGEITYHDEQMGEFFAALREQGLLDETLVVISNDHGEEMFDHGKVGHGHSLFEELIRSPLLLRYPPLLPQGGEVSEPVELVDLVPTVLEILAAPPLAGTDGASLLGLSLGRSGLGGHYALAEFQDHRRAIRLGHYKLIASAARARLYDLAADPGEQQDLSDDRPVGRRACEVHLYEGLAISDKQARLSGKGRRRRHQATRTKLDGQLREQLRALGYVD